MIRDVKLVQIGSKRDICNSNTLIRAKMFGVLWVDGHGHARITCITIRALI